MDDITVGMIMGGFSAVIVSTIALFVNPATFDATVVSACEKQGYWQTGQKRVICAVEAPKSK